MAKEYLDKSGLTYLWSKMKDKFALKSETYTKAEVDAMISDIQDILADAILKSTAS